MRERGGGGGILWFSYIRIKLVDHVCFLSFEIISEINGNEKIK